MIITDYFAIFAVCHIDFNMFNKMIKITNCNDMLINQRSKFILFFQLRCLCGENFD